jgi:hypothetical protein
MTEVCKAPAESRITSSVFISPNDLETNRFSAICRVHQIAGSVFLGLRSDIRSTSILISHAILHLRAFTLARHRLLPGALFWIPFPVVTLLLKF